MSERLLLGGMLDLLGTIPQAHCTFATHGLDASWGNPQPITESLTEWALSGARVTLVGYGNRELFLRVTIKGPTLDDVAVGEGLLFGLLGRRTTLEWRPPDTLAAPVVFEVEFSRLDHEFDDHGEATRCERTYGIVFECRPFPRAKELTLSPVLTAPVPPVEPYTPVLIHDCDTTTGWTANPLPTQSASGYVYTGWTVAEPEGPMGGGPGWVRLTPTADLDLAQTVDFTGTPYLVVEWQVRRPNGTRRFDSPEIYLRTTFEGPFRPIYEQRLADDWVRSVYDLTGYGVLGRIKVRSVGVWGHKHRLLVRNVERAAVVPVNGSTTGHQMTRVITVEGSAPTEASLHMWSDAGGLRDVLVHTSSTPHGMVSLEPYLSSSVNPVPSAGTVSGSLKPIDSDLAWWLPTGLFDPTRATSYMLLARLSGVEGEVTADVVAWSGIGSPVPIPGVILPAETSTVDVDAPAAAIVALGVFTVPPHLVDGEQAGVGVRIQGDTLPGTPMVDDAWLVDIETGHLTWASTPGGSAWEHLWIESPTLAYPMPRVRIARDVDGDSGREAEVHAMGRHEWPPGDVYVTTVATDVVGSSIQASYFERAHTHLVRRSS